MMKTADYDNDVIMVLVIIAAVIAVVLRVVIVITVLVMMIIVITVTMVIHSATVTVATTVVLSRSVFFPKELNKDSDTNKEVKFSLLKRGPDVMERRLLKNKTDNSTNKLNVKAKTLIYIKLCQDTSILLLLYN